jgi:hypothetical protein
VALLLFLFCIAGCAGLLWVLRRTPSHSEAAGINAATDAPTVAATANDRKPSKWAARLSSFASSRIGRVAFWFWVVGGIPWVVGIWYHQDCWERRFPNDRNWPSGSAFHFAKGTPEQWAQMSAEHRLWLTDRLARQESMDGFLFEKACLLLGSGVYGLVGFVLFCHRWQSAGSVAVVIVLLTFLASLEIDIR